MPSGSVSGCRKPISTWPSRSRAASSALGFCTLTTASASHGSSTSVAPASSYAASGNDGRFAGAALDDDLEARRHELADDLRHERHAALAGSVSLGTPTRMPGGCYVRRAAVRFDVEFAVVAGPLAEIADSFFRPAVKDLVPVRAGEAGRGGAARARARARASSSRRTKGRTGRSRRRARRSSAASPSSTATRTAAPTGCGPRSPSGYGVRFEEVAVGAGSDGLSTASSQAVARARRRDRLRLALVPELRDRRAQARRRCRGTVPLRDDRYDLDAMLEAIGAADEARLRLPPEQPDRDDEHARRARRVVRARARARRSPCSTRPTSSTSTTRTTRTAIEELPQAGPPRRRAAHVLEDLRARRAARRLRGRAGRASSPAIDKVRRAFDVTTPAQEAALASLDDAGRARAAPARERRAARAELERILREHGLDPVGPAVGELPLRRGRRRLAAALRAAARARA